MEFKNLRQAIKGTFKNQELDSIFEKCFLNTIDTTLTIKDDDYFVITGDIPAMWLRDSAMQVFHYLYFRWIFLCKITLFQRNIQVNTTLFQRNNRLNLTLFQRNVVFGHIVRLVS